MCRKSLIPKWITVARLDKVTYSAVLSQKIRGVCSFIYQQRLWKLPGKLVVTVFGYKWALIRTTNKSEQQFQTGHEKLQKIKSIDHKSDRRTKQIDLDMFQLKNTNWTTQIRMQLGDILRASSGGLPITKPKSNTGENQ